MARRLLLCFALATVGCVPLNDVSPFVDGGIGDGTGGSVGGGLGGGGGSTTGSLGLPVRDAFGSPIDVALVILGHSTSRAGDYPAKLARVLNANALDGRNYVVFRLITPGDGGFLWSQLGVPSTDPQYNRVKASASNQWCQDQTGKRWSCRRLRVERGLRGIEPAPAECAPPAFTTDCSPPVIATCTWHENGQVLQQTNVDFTTCLSKMDVRLALIQDTTNRSWPVDDINVDGAVTGLDFFSATRAPSAVPCLNSAGFVGSSLDWDCDGALGPGDAAASVYAGWLQRLSMDLLTGFGNNSMNHVFLSHKPVEMGACQAYPGEPCSNHGLRTPTAWRPFNHFYLPSVYWEHRGLVELFLLPGLDSRIHPAGASGTATEVLRMWNRSAGCYESGVQGTSWATPADAGRPTSVVADDSEADAPDGGNSTFVGCLVSDHIHHNEAGGWLMADVWYAGLGPYLFGP